MKKTTVIAVRLPADLALRIKAYAVRKQTTVSGWLLPIISRAVNVGKKKDT